MRTRRSARWTLFNASSVSSRLPSSTKMISAGSENVSSTPASAAWHSRIIAPPLLKTGMTMEITWLWHPASAGRRAEAEGVDDDARRRRRVGWSRDSNAVVSAAPDLRARRHDEHLARRPRRADLERQRAERRAVDGDVEIQFGAGRGAVGAHLDIDAKRRVAGHVERHENGSARRGEEMRRSELIAGAVLPAVHQKAFAPVVQRQLH